MTESTGQNPDFWQLYRWLILNSSRALSIGELSELCDEIGITGHLAVLCGPYIKKILSGEKVIESRFSSRKIMPFGAIMPKDIVLLKQSGGSLNGMMRVSNVEFFGPLRHTEARQIMLRYLDKLQVDPEFIELKSDSRYATLIYFDDVISLPQITIEKNDRRSWIILNRKTHNNMGFHQMSFLD